MRRTISVLLTGALLAVQPVIAEPKARKGVSPVEPPIESAKENGIKAKNALYDALITEGFAKDEAFRLVLADDGASFPDLNQ